MNEIPTVKGVLLRIHPDELEKFDNRCAEAGVTRTEALRRITHAVIEGHYKIPVIETPNPEKEQL